MWFGGHHERTLERIAKWGDGWMPNAYPPDQSALDIFAKLRALTEAAGRDPNEIGIEVWTSMGSGSEADWAKEAKFWKAAGATHLCLTTTFHRRHHHRLAGTSMKRPCRRAEALSTPLSPTRCNNITSTCWRTASRTLFTTETVRHRDAGRTVALTASVPLW